MDFGVIIHYGIYSFYAYDSIKSAKRRSTQNGSEWYKGRLDETGKSYRPVPGWKETQEYHSKNFPDKDYYDVNMNIENVDNWISLCKDIGTKYVILTMKHHDGFCLWDTKTTDKKYNLLDIFINSCKKFGIDYGFYYSWMEFTENFNLKYFNNICINQLTELSQYNPKYMWFDGDWLITQKSVLKKIDEIVPKSFKNCIINDRIGKRNLIGYPSYVSYRVYKDRYIPLDKMENWQHINTIGYSWGRNKDQKPEDYKNGEELYELYKTVKDLGGSFLINIGPDFNGDIDIHEENSLREFSKI